MGSPDNRPVELTPEEYDELLEAQEASLAREEQEDRLRKGLLYVWQLTPERRSLIEQEMREIGSDRALRRPQ